VEAVLQECKTEVRVMNYRLQFSPLFGTPQPQQEPQLDLPVRERREGPTLKWEDADIFHSWLVYDSDSEAEGSRSRINWNAVLGHTLAVAVSLTIWIGVALMVASR
jgi:hypothetical protein